MSLAPLLGSHVVARLTARGSALILRSVSRARVAALDQVDGIERAVDRVIAPEEEAGQRHHLAATIGHERREETGHRPVQEHSQPPAPRQDNEHGGEPENHRTEPGLRHPLAKEPEEGKVQDRGQKQTACESFEKQRGWSKMRNLRSNINESQQAKHETRPASAPAYLPSDGKSAMFRLQ